MGWLIPFFFWSAVSIGLAIAIAELTWKKPKTTIPAPDEFDFQTQREGTKYTVNFGTNWIENPVVAWWGDTSTVAIVVTTKYKTWYGSTKKINTVTGYQYRIGIQYVVTQGANDGIIQIKANDKVAWPDPADKTSFHADGETLAVVDALTLFGPADQAGGFGGKIAFQYGDSSQLPNSYLTDVLGSDISAMRGLTTATLLQCYVGNSPYGCGCKFLVKRNLKLTTGEDQWYLNKAAINTYDLNAAHIIRECLTDTVWGKKISTSRLPAATWTDFADALYGENFGLSLKWEGQTQTLDDFIKDVLRHIDAVLYEDPETGDIIPKLIRDDYDEETVDRFDEDTIDSLDQYSVGVVLGSPNKVSMSYWNRIDNKPVSIQDYNLTSIYLQDNKIVPYEINFYGITDDDLAQSVNTREQNRLSAFPFAVQIRGNRKLASVRPGDVIRISYIPYEIVQMFLRVLNVNLGTLKNSRVSLECVQDIFSLPSTIFGAAPPTQWEDPRNDPAPAPYYLLLESTFWDLFLDGGGLSSVAALDDDSGFLIVAASKPSTDALDYELMLRNCPTCDFISDGIGAFTPTGTLLNYLPMDADDVLIAVADDEGLSNVEINTYCVIDDEILKVKSVEADDSNGNPQYTLARGCLDTVPAYHDGPESSSGAARVWFVGSVAYMAGREFTATDQPGVKILPGTGKGRLSDDTAHNADAFNSRMIRPYPPGNFKINSASYPISFSGQPTLTWAHRDRTQQINGIMEHSAASVGPEAGTTYTLQIYDENNNLVRTESGLTGTTYTYSEADEMSDCGLDSGDPLNLQLRFVLKSVRDGYDSWQSYDITVQRV